MSEEITNPATQPNRSALQVVIELIRKDRLVNADEVIKTYDKLIDHFTGKPESGN